MKLEIIKTVGDDTIAKVYIARTPQGKYLEFAEAWDHEEDRWVLNNLLRLFGCPVGCSICDAGSYFVGQIK